MVQSKPHLLDCCHGVDVPVPHGGEGGKGPVQAGNVQVAVGLVRKSKRRDPVPGARNAPQREILPTLNLWGK